MNIIIEKSSLTKCSVRQIRQIIYYQLFKHPLRIDEIDGGVDTQEDLDKLVSQNILYQLDNYYSIVDIKKNIEKRLKLRNPIYTETAAYGHMGRKSEIVSKTFNLPSGESKTFEVELFTWEKLDFIDEIKKQFK